MMAGVSPVPLLRTITRPRTVENIPERNVQTILELEEAAKANRSDADRIANHWQRVAKSSTSAVLVPEE
jgi:hypothetical protein